MSGMPWPIDSLPNVHPALVHFPVAILPLAVASDAVLIATAVPRGGRGALWLERMALALYAAGTTGAAAAFFTGRNAGDSMTGILPDAFMAMARHSDLALRTLGAFLLILVVRAILFWKDRKRPELSLVPVRMIVIAAGIGGLLLLADTADRGGGLVYRHGLAVAATVEDDELPSAAAMPAETIPSAAESLPADRLRQSEDGAIIWMPAPGDFDAFGGVLRPAGNTSFDVLRPADGAGTAGLTFDVNGAATALLPGEFDNVMVETEIDLSEFEGTVGLDHHVRGEGTGGRFRILTGGRAALLDLAKGRNLGSGDAELSGTSARIALSVAGRHLKGLVDGKMIAHGHEPYPEPGACGLFLEGFGRVRIVSLKVTPLEGG